MTNPARQYHAHDEPDNIGRATLPARNAVLAILVLSLLLWWGLWFAMTWTIAVLQG